MSAIYNGQEDINAVANFFFLERGRDCWREWRAFLVGRMITLEIFRAIRSREGILKKFVPT